MTEEENNNKEDFAKNCMQLDSELKQICMNRYNAMEITAVMSRLLGKIIQTEENPEEFLKIIISLITVAAQQKDF